MGGIAEVEKQMSSKSNGEGRWQIGFWVFTFICGIILTGLTNAVIANDRMRATEDTRIESSFGGKLGVVSDKLSLMSSDISEIKAILRYQFADYSKFKSPLSKVEN